MRQEWVGKRQAVRTNVQLRAQMRFGVGRPAVDCTVMDISLTGARIVTPDEGPYPNDFDIYIPARSETKWARVRWREKLQLGVEFLKVRQDDRDGIEATVLDRLMRLEDKFAEAARLSPTGASVASAELEDRLIAIETRLPEPGDSGESAAVGQIAALQARIEALEEVAPTSPAPGKAGLEESRFEALLDRLAHFESRLAELEDGVRSGSARAESVERRAEDLAGRLQNLEGGAAIEAVAGPGRSSSAEAGAQAGASAEAESRMRGFESSLGELRASLRTLILLMASQIKRSNA